MIRHMEGWTTTEVGGPGERLGDPRLRWRVLASSFVIAGVLALLAVAGPHACASDALVAGLAIGAVAAGVVVFRTAGTLPDACVPVVVVLGAALLDYVVIATGDPATPYAFFYPWLGASAFFFMRVRGAIALVAFVALSYAVALAVSARPESDEVARWVITVGTVAVVGAIAGSLRHHAAGLHVRATDAAARAPLTGALNRRGFDDALPVEVDRAARGARTVSVVIADLDGLQTVNVATGRARGDEAVRGLAAL